ncbi:MAG TPA: RHS repeat-associated core domain-containing protein [Polyangiaceae bacterium]|nr:RHS repeat-associated core domain-containing protein [Polyangiaceae bacterium]
MGGNFNSHAYDSLGNLQQKRLSRTLDGTITAQTIEHTPHCTRPHLLATIGANTYTYDAKGNLTGRAGPDVPGGEQLIEYTLFDLPKKVITGPSATGQTTRFEYSANEERLVRRDADAKRHFVPELYQRLISSNGATVEERFALYAGDRPLGEIVRKNDTDEVLYFHTDRLGTVDTISTSTSDVVQQGFDPFGAPLASPGPEVTRAGFTGHQHDRDLGLIDMRGRVYDPFASRFATPDPVTQAPYWSQGLNRYAYVFNDPSIIRIRAGL